MKKGQDTEDNSHKNGGKGLTGKRCNCKILASNKI